MSDQPEICLNELLNQRQKEGKPLLVLQPSSTSTEVVKALQRILPADKQSAVVLVDLSKSDDSSSMVDYREE